MKENEDTNQNKCDEQSFNQEAARKTMYSIQRLSPREWDISRLVPNGLSDKEIADRLGMTEGTVGWHLNRIFKRLRIHSRTALAAQVMQRQLPPT